MEHWAFTERKRGIGMAGGASQPGRSVAGKLLALLGAFDEDHPVLTLTELAARAHLPLATAHRLVAEVTAWGGMQRRADGRYTVGSRLWDIGLLAPVRTDLRASAAPFLQDLYGATLATVHFAVRDGHQVLYLDRLSGRATVPVVSTIGSRLPLHATGVGKALLAHAPAEVVRYCLSHLTRHTTHTITAPGQLVEQLRRIRSDGYATTTEEMSIGACSVAVPVRAGPDGAVTAALGVVVPDLRRDRARLVAALRVAAHGIGRSLAGAHRDEGSRATSTQ